MSIFFEYLVSAQKLLVGAFEIWNFWIRDSQPVLKSSLDSVVYLVTLLCLLFFYVPTNWNHPSFICFAPILLGKSCNQTDWYLTHGCKSSPSFSTLPHIPALSFVFSLPCCCLEIVNYFKLSSLLTILTPSPASFFIVNRLPLLLNRKIRSLQLRNPEFSYKKSVNFLCSCSCLACFPVSIKRCLSSVWRMTFCLCLILWFHFNKETLKSLKRNILSVSIF